MKKFEFLIAPVISVVLGCILFFLNLFVENTSGVLNSIITAAGLLAGLLFASLSLVLSLPANNAAIVEFKKHRFIEYLIKNLTCGVGLNILVLVVSLITLPPIVIILIFFAALGSLIRSGYIMYNILMSISVNSKA